MEAKIIKKDNGHDVFINGNWVMWVTGSEKNAKKELDLYLRD